MDERRLSTNPQVVKEYYKEQMAELKSSYESAKENNNKDLAEYLEEQLIQTDIARAEHIAEVEKINREQWEEALDYFGF